MIRVVALAIHPVKSTAIRSVQRARVSFAGLAGDREWMIVNDFGEMVTAREFPPLFSIAADCATTGLTDGDLQLSAPTVEPLRLDRPVDGPQVSVRMFTRPPMTVRSAGDAADAWLDRALGTQGLHLVWCSDPTARSLNPAYGKPGDHAALQDGSPVSLLGTASVRALQERMDEPVGHERFRANVLIDGAEAFAEDGWERVRIGSVPFRVAASIDRCVMTTIDPATFAKSKEPIRTLAGFRRWEGKTWMAVHLIPDGEGEIAVGDEVLPAG
ncbi:MOSC domain-containing protein [Calidifontibacter terrae]